MAVSLGFPAVEPDQAWNTAVSFVTNTNWQSYSGESTMGHLVQMAGLAVQNFVSAAVGIAVAVALVRGFARAKTDQLGNFWVDLVRICVRILLPIAVVGAIVFIAGGVVQNLSAGTDVHHAGRRRRQHITGGPVASQEVIKELGTNGGGFYNANCGAPVREPDHLDELDRDLPAPGDPVQPAAGLRPDGRRQAAGLRDRRRHGDPGDRQRRRDQRAADRATAARCRPRSARRRRAPRPGSGCRSRRRSPRRPR